MGKNSSKVRTGIFILCTVVFIAVAGYLFYEYQAHQPSPVPTPPESVETAEESETPPSPPQALTPPRVPLKNLHKIIYEVGALGPYAERLAYQNRAMILKIPRLDCEVAVLEGMSPSIKAGGEVDSAMDEGLLNQGVVLFNQSQLPGAENRNVSIAGHRDIHGKEFYSIDTLTDGDFLYLYYNGKEYQYLYKDTAITDAYTWDYVVTSEYSTLTLQSCTPIGVATERIFAYGHLLDVRDLSPEEITTFQAEYPALSATQTFWDDDGNVEDIPEEGTPLDNLPLLPQGTIEER